MDMVFKVLGALLVCYVAVALVRGEVYAKSGVWGRTFSRNEHAFNYWGAIVAYSTLALALLFVF